MADSEPKKRRLKAPAQTVRQQAEKAQAESDKPAKNRRLKSAAATTRKPLGRIGRLFNRQPFKFFGRILAPKFARNAYAELRQVQWPNTRQTARLTFAVLAFAIVFGGLVTIVDYGLDKVFRALIIK